MAYSDFEAQQDELLALTEIFEDSFTSEMCQELKILVGEIKITINLRNQKYFNFSQNDQNFCVTKEIDISNQVELHHLPPLILKFKCPPDYPSKSKPNFTLCSTWLHLSQLSLLCAHLDDIWKNYVGLGVLYQWVDFLTENTAQIINLDQINLVEIASNPFPLQDFKEDSTIRDSIDFRATLEPSEYLNGNSSLINYLKKFNDEQIHVEFTKSTFSCPICLTMKKGIDCTKFSACSHIFCIECVREHFKLHIQNGTIQQIKCLEFNCQTQPTHSEIECLVSTEEFQRYDRLVLSNSLNRMQDILYCPRLSCQSPGFVNHQDNLAAVCLACGYSFCSDCKKGYHGVQPCFSAILEPNDKNSNDEDGEDQLDSQSIDQVEQQKKNTRCIIDRFNLEPKFRKAAGTQQWVNTNCQPCPGCNVAINKDGGCNHMHCSQCETDFCWDDAEREGKDPPIWLGGKLWLRHRLYNRCNCGEFNN